MPDDIQVTEQITEMEDAGAAEAQDFPTEEEDGGFGEGFNTPSDKDGQPEKKEEKKPDAVEEKKPEEKKDEKEVLPDKEKKPEEEDPDIKRGREIQEANAKRKADQDKAETDRKAKEDEDKQRQAKEEAKVLYPVEQRHVDSIAKFVSPELIPDKVKIGGQDFDLKTYVNDNPEIAVVAGIVANNMLQALVNNGVLVTGDALSSRLSESIKGTDNSDVLFDLQVRARGISDPEAIIASPEYKEWYGKVAKPEEKALFDSDDPADHVKGFKRFQKYSDEKTNAVKAEEEKKVKEAEAKHKKKANFYSRSMASTVASPKGEAVSSNPDEAFEQGFTSKTAPK